MRNLLWQHEPSKLSSWLIWTINIFNKINANSKCKAKLFRRCKAMQHLHHAPFLAHCTVHTVVPSIVAWDDKNLHTYSKPSNKHQRLEGLLRFKKPNISQKLYSFRAGFYQVLWSYVSLHTFETVLLPAVKYAVTLGEKRCLYISGKKKKKSANEQTKEYNGNDENRTVKELYWRAISELKISCSIKECATKLLWYILPVFLCA